MVTNLKLQTRRLKLVELLILVLMGVLMYVSQVIMAPLPNIELVSFLTIIVARRFGVKSLVSAYTFALLETLKAIACSLPPLPMINTFIVISPN